MSRILFVSYDGVLDPVGRSQIAEPLRELGRRGHAVRVVSFEKAEVDDSPAAHRLRSALEEDGVEWTALRYHRWPPVLSTAWDLARGVVAALRVARRQRPEVVQGRSYVAGLVAALVSRLRGIPFVFEMRAFWVEEKIDSGAWHPSGPLTALAYRCERFLFAEADAVLVSSRTGIRRIRARPGRFPVREGCPLILARTSVDLERFRPRAEEEAPPEAPPRGGGPVLLYLGSLSGWYRSDAVFRLLAAVAERSPGTRLLLLGGADPARVEDGARAEGASPLAVLRHSLPPDEVPRWLCLGDVGVLFFRELDSRSASSPIKVSEYLAAGLPVVMNRDPGDLAELVEEAGAGWVVDGTDRASLDRVARELADEAGELARRGARARALAEAHFSLASMVDAYEESYRTVAG